MFGFRKRKVLRRKKNVVTKKIRRVSEITIGGEVNYERFDRFPFFFRSCNTGASDNFELRMPANVNFADANERKCVVRGTRLTITSEIRQKPNRVVRRT